AVSTKPRERSNELDHAQLNEIVMVRIVRADEADDRAIDGRTDPRVENGRCRRITTCDSGKELGVVKRRCNPRPTGRFGNLRLGWRLDKAKHPWGFGSGHHLDRTPSRSETGRREKL